MPSLSVASDVLMISARRAPARLPGLCAGRYPPAFI